MAQSLGQLVVELVAEDKNLQRGLANAVQATKNAQTKISELTISPDFDVASLEAKLKEGTATLTDFAGASVEEMKEFEKGLNEGATEAVKEFGRGVEGGTKPLKDVPPTTASANQAFGQHGVAIDDTRQRYREFFQQQRLQDRQFSEARGTIGALSGVYLLLGSNTSASSKSMVTLNESLAKGIGAANGMEFALFSLGQAGGKLPGGLGSIATSIAGLAGPISLAVGAGALLLAFFQKSGEEANKAIEAGLRDFNEEIGKLSRPQQVRLFADVEAEVKTVKDSLGELINARQRLSANRPELNIVGASPEELARIDENIEKLERRRSVLDKEHETLKGIVETAEAIDFANQLSQKSLEKNTSETQTRERTIKNLRREVESLVSDENRSEKANQQIVEKKERLVQLEREQRADLQTSVEREQDKTNLIQKQVELGTATRQQLIAQLEAQKAIADKQGDTKAALEAQLAIENQLKAERQDAIAVTELKIKLGVQSQSSLIAELNTQLQSAKTEKERLEIRSRILDVVRATRDAELEILSKKAGLEPEPTTRKLKEEDVRFDRELEENRKKFSGDKKILDEVNRVSEQTHVRNVLNIERERTEEIAQLRLRNIENEHTRKLAAIDIEAAKALGDFELADTGGESSVRAQETFDAKSEDIQRRRNQLDLDHVNEINALNIQGIVDEEERLTARYEYERGLILAKVQDEQLTDAQLANLKADYERNLATITERRIQSEIQGVQQLGQILVQLGSKFGNDLLSNLGQALQIAIQISKALSASKSGAEGGDSLSILSSFISIFSLFAEGGVVGKGGELQPASRPSRTIPQGSFVVNETQAKLYEPLLDALGAGTVTGGIRGKDSVPFAIEGTGEVALLAPNERIVAPRYAAIAEKVNEGRSVTEVLSFAATTVTGVKPKRFQGGGIVGTELIKTAQQFVSQGISGKIELPKEFLERLRSPIDLAPLIEQMQTLTGEVERLRTETTDILQSPQHSTVDIDNGQMFSRRHIQDATDFLHESQT